MSGAVAFDPWLPATVDGGMAFCGEIGADSARIELPNGGPPPAAGGTVALVLYANRWATVSGTAVVAATPPGAEDAVVLRFGAELRAAIPAFLSTVRKGAHLSITRNEDVESKETRSGFDRIRLPHEALPEIDANDVDLRASFFGRPLRAPIVISGMTGGSPRAGEINARLARVAQRLGFAMGVGSQRAMWESPALAPSYDLRAHAPDVPVIANVGAVQLNHGIDADHCQRLVEAIDAQALAIHLNVLQELVQPEGDRHWRGLGERIAAVVEHVQVPVILKETGCGLSGAVARRGMGWGVQGFDVGGLGGTHWGWVEGFRTNDPERRALAGTFREWGIPTAQSVREVRAAVGDGPLLIATGGLRSGLDAARALVLGADLAGFALPFFRAADRGEDEALAFGERLVDELRIAVMCSGAGSVGVLRSLPFTEVLA